MRYYNFSLNTNSEKIKSNAIIRLNDYDYDSVTAILNEITSYKNEMLDIDEVSTYQYIDDLIEAKRRAYIVGGPYNYLTDVNEFVYGGIVDKERFRHYGFVFEEKMISEMVKSKKCLYDQSLLSEIANIESLKNDTGFSGNMVHYVVSSKSFDAAIDIVETLVQSLYRANRLSSRRIEIIKDIDAMMYRNNDNLENLISGNRGGAIVIDMTERMGRNPVDYDMNCQYIAKLVKKYKNDCLFIFTYNIDNPGFAYQLVPLAQKQVAMVKIKEATGTRKNAVDYLKVLIKGSEYSEYANQANAFFKSYRGDKFSQSDVLEAYEMFEPWCINQNFGNAYNINFDEDFLLDREVDDVSPSEKLNKMIGLKEVKEQINKIIVNNIIERERKLRNDKKYEASTMHMIFSGNPGSAKTTVAKLFAGIAKEHNILKSGAFVVRGGMDYNTMFATPIIERDFEAAKGGVLFIDEAYALISPNSIATLIQEMENNRENVIVILAGYSECMQDFLERNEGLKSRIPYWVDFPDYSADELVDIFKLMADEHGFSITSEALNKALIAFDKARVMDNFGNGRFARNLFENSVQNQSMRLNEQYKDVSNIPENELFILEADDIVTSDDEAKEQRLPGTAKAELDKMIGIEAAKKLVNKAVATFKVKKLYSEKGIRTDKPSMHMVFTGNPGTAKTTTARLLAEILRDEKVLPSGKFVEVGRADLVGSHVGETAQIVKRRFKDAQGGVLFIDEAYSLCDYHSNSYGDEAINTIVQEMENHREDTIVIFAGYPKEMEEFLERNPGMKSRIAFHIDFEDYSTDDLCDIAKLMLENKSLKATDEAMIKLRTIVDRAKEKADYGNGRFVRRILEEAEMNLALRIASLDESVLDMKLLTTIEACDIEEPEEGKDTSVQMGFRAC